MTGKWIAKIVKSIGQQSKTWEEVQAIRQEQTAAHSLVLAISKRLELIEAKLGLEVGGPMKQSLQTFLLRARNYYGVSAVR